jgi:hypothetical protein
MNKSKRKDVKKLVKINKLTADLVNYFYNIKIKNINLLLL